jgi:membrane protease YdiL (CAAX protease family)
MCFYFVIEPAFLKNLPVHAPLIPALLSSIIMFRYQPSLLRWAKFGRIDRRTAGLMILTIVGTVVSLVLWANWSMSFGSATDLVRSFRTMPFGLVVGGLIPLFALTMPLAEEILYRGILLESLEPLTSSNIAQIAQAVTYAAFHFRNGFPSGNVGFAMVFVFGLILGHLRRRSGGLLAPYIVHVFADLTIGYFLVFATGLGQ